MQQVIRVPTSKITRNDLSIGVHWVWKPLFSKCNVIADLIIFSGYVKDYLRVKHASPNDYLLSDNSNFKPCNELEVDYDGNYLVYDKIRSMFIRFGCASVGMKNRWSLHVTASKRQTKTEMESRFYTSYASVDCHN